MQKNPNSTLLPSLAVALSGVIWGLFWIPIRQMDAHGVTSSWSLFLSLGVTALCFLPFFFRQWQKTGRLPWGVLLTGLMSGICIVFYAVSLLLTEVVKTVLLVYLIPVWSTILGRVLLKETITPYRISAVICGLAGLAVILGIAEGIPKFSNIGDLLALIGGFFWSYATVRIRADETAAVWEQVGAFYIGGAAVALVFILFPPPGLAAAPTTEMVFDALFWLIIFIVAYLPSIFLMFWGAQILSPGRVGILLLTEVIFGVISAAFLAGEPVGWTEIIGTVLIFSAAVIDVSDRLNASN